MAAVQFQVFHTPCRAHPLHATSTAKQCTLLAYHSLADSVAVVTRRRIRLKFHDLIWRTPSKPNCFSLVRTRTYTLKTVSFQAVAADHDSEGSETSVPSAQDAHFMADGRQTIRLRNFLLSSCENFNELASALRKPGTTIKFKVIVDELRSRMQVLKKEKFHSIFEGCGTPKWLQTLDPWILWPAAIFGTSYIMMAVVAGIGAANELLPLWILGPLMTGFLINMVHETIRVTKKIAAKYSGYHLVVREKTHLFYQDAITGKLPAKIMMAGSNKIEWLKITIETKKKTLIFYVQSGQAYLDLLNLLNQLRDRMVERYDDYKEWIWPYWRTLLRYLRKYF